MRRHIWFTLWCAIYYANKAEKLNSFTNCIGCNEVDNADHRDVNDYLRLQKIANRLEYIKRQMANNLYTNEGYMSNNSQKSNRLPEFLIEQLTNNKRQDISIREAEDSTQSKRFVLFPKEKTINCHPTLNNSVCLEFKLPDDTLISGDILSAFLWFNGRQFHSNETITSQNFIITDANLLNVKRRHRETYLLQENDGWYRHEITNIIKSGRANTKTIILACETCSQNVDEKSIIFEDEQIPFLLLNTEIEKNSRSKRGVACIPGNNECCRENLNVDLATFDEFSNVVHPRKFNAYVCKGSCYYHSAVNAEKPYATLLVKLKLHKEMSYQLPTSCCTPTKFSDLTVMYANNNLTVSFVTIPNMIVESCGCI